MGKPDPSALVFTMYGLAVPMSALTTELESWSHRPVTDKTNLKGSFDVLLRFSPEASRATAPPVGAQPDTPAAPDPPGPSIFTAIQEDLGLKLESSKGQTEVLVIDSVQRPTEN
jgi:uncharacterized protein (TIGR03435 family)